MKKSILISVFIIFCFISAVAGFSEQMFSAKYSVASQQIAPTLKHFAKGIVETAADEYNPTFIFVLERALFRHQVLAKQA